VAGAQRPFADGEHLEKNRLSLGMSRLKEVARRQLVERLGIFETALGVTTLDKATRRSARGKASANFPAFRSWLICWAKLAGSSACCAFGSALFPNHRAIRHEPASAALRQIRTRTVPPSGTGSKRIVEVANDRRKAPYRKLEAADWRGTSVPGP
jgi:hypothetical protein